MEYLKRIADEQLALRLEAFGAVQIRGPKWCGKTTTAEQFAKSKIKLQDPDRRAGSSHIITTGTDLRRIWSFILMIIAMR